MTGKKKIFIAVGILLNILLCAGLYANYQLDHVVLSLSQPGILFPGADPGSHTDEPDLTDETGLNDTGTGTGAAEEQQNTENGSSPELTPQNNSSAPNLDSNSKVAIAGSVQKKINRPIEKTDLIKAGVIILRRLNSEEISYLYRVGSHNSYTHEEYLQVHKILQAKLSEEDIATLKELGQKYGKNLNVLD